MDNRPPWPVRRSLRLKDYNYASAGAYFVTFCTQDRTPALGGTVDGEMAPSQAGQIVRRSWEDLRNHHSGIEIPAFAMMPDHVHGIACTLARCTESLSEIIRGFKTFSARRINETHGTPGIPVWKRGFYEHVIRNEADMEEIVQYIAENPSRWDEQHAG